MRFVHFGAVLLEKLRFLNVMTASQVVFINPVESAVAATACANLSRFSSEASVFSDALGILPPAPAFYLEDSWVESAAS